MDSVITMKKSKRRGSLSDVYYDVEKTGSYGGVARLAKNAKVRHEKAKRWLAGQDAYTLHKPVRYKFPRRKVVVSGPGQQWQADLVDVSRLARANGGHKFLLTIIDVFSKKAWVVPLKSKKGSDVLKAFESIEDRPPKYLHTDKGTEFINRHLKTWLKKHGVHFFHTENEDIKASIVERFNRTLKTKMWRYFTKHATSTYLDVLPALVDTYNRTFHRSIGMAPVQVNASTTGLVWRRLYGRERPPVDKKDDLKPGDSVRISKARRAFTKGYKPRWTEEVFTVERVQRTSPVTFVLKDFAGDTIRGSFYRQELQKIDKTDGVYRIEKILKKDKNRVFVKWSGYPEKFNSWVMKKHLVGV